MKRRGVLVPETAVELAAAAGDVDVLEVDDVLAEPGHRERLQLHLVADLGHVGDEGVGGLMSGGKGRAANERPYRLRASSQDFIMAISASWAVITASARRRTSGS